jgi:hypothetical protein
MWRRQEVAMVHQCHTFHGGHLLDKALYLMRVAAGCLGPQPLVIVLGSARHYSRVRAKPRTGRPPRTRGRTDRPGLRRHLADSEPCDRMGAREARGITVTIAVPPEGPDTVGPRRLAMRGGENSKLVT